MCENIVNYASPYLVGYGSALVGGQIFMLLILSPLWRKLGLPNKDRHGYWHSVILGLTEGTAYISALLSGNPQFIAVWLGLKTVIRWRHWESDVAIPPTNGGETTWVLGRNAYNLFLLGNALVVVYAAIGWKLTIHMRAHQLSHVLAIAIAAIVWSCVIAAIAWSSPKYDPLKDSDPRLAKNLSKA